MVLVRLREGEKFYHTLHPSVTVLVLSLCPDGKVNAMPAGWNMPVSEEPPTVAVAVDKEAYTFKCIEHIKEVTINVPRAEQADLVYTLGTISGREVDKIKAFGLRLEPSAHVAVPRWADAIASMEGRVYAMLDIGEVRLYVFEILAAYVEEGLYTRWGWDTSKVSPLMHGAGRSFYKVGDLIRVQKLEVRPS